MNDIRDHLDLVADLADPQAMPDATGIRRGGDRRRRQARAVTAGVALAVAAAIALPAAVDSVSDRQSAPPAERDERTQDDGTVSRDSGLPGWRLARRIPVADEGVALATHGSIWVVDRADGRYDPDTGLPAGVLHRIDPATGRVTATVPGAVGGWPTVYRGSIWLAFPPGGRLIKVDLDTLETTVIRTTDTGDPQLRGLVGAEGAVWVNNSADGTLVRVDPSTGEVTQRLDLGSKLDAKVDPGPPVLWRDLIWVLLYDSDEIVAVDPQTGRVVLRQTNPTRVVADGLYVDDDRLVVVNGGQLTQLEQTESGALRAGTVIPPALPESDIATTTEAYGRRWLLTWSDGELLELDPETREVLGRVDVPTTGPQTDVAPSMVAAYGSIWVRVYNRLLEYRPVD